MYGKIVRGKLYKAPSKIRHEDGVVFSPGIDVLSIYGYKKIEYSSPPEDMEGKSLEYYWEESDDTIFQKWKSDEYPKHPLQRLENLVLNFENSIREIKNEVSYNTKGKTDTIQDTYKEKENNEFFQYIIRKVEEKFPSIPLYKVVENNKLSDANRWNEILELKQYYESKGYLIDEYVDAYIEENQKKYRVDSFISECHALSLIAKLQKSIDEKSTMYNMVLINLVAILDYYLLEIINIVCSVESNVLIDKNAKIDLKDILNYKDFEGVINLAISNKINELGYQDINTKIDFIKSIGVSLDNICDFWKDDIILLYEKRNLLVHNGGFVNSGMQNKLSKTKYKNSFTNGENLSPNREDTEKYISFISMTANEVYLKVKNKFFKSK